MDTKDSLGQCIKHGGMAADAMLLAGNKETLTGQISLLVMKTWRTTKLSVIIIARL